MSNMLLDNKILKILKEFSSDYSKKLYGRDIAKKLKINQKTVSNVLIKLAKENILDFTEEGKNKYYFLNKFNPNIKEIIKIIEINKKIDFLNKHKNLITLFEEIEKRTNNLLVIFGSYAKGEETSKSDIDLFILGNIKDINDLEEMYNIKINVIKAKTVKLINDVVFKEIIKSHIILKGEDEFIKLIKW